jgi:spore germination cell wall hydrolase CwlJ-like protein
MKNLIIGILVSVASLPLLGDYVAATLILEAGGEGTKGMEAVHEVISNRASKRGTTKVHEVFRRKQFSCWNNIEKRDKLYRHAQEHPRYAEALRIVRGELTNHTKGATHYHADYVDPYWSTSYTRTVKIKRHIFYK